MGKKRPARLSLKTLSLVIVGIVALSLLVACNSSPPPAEKPAEPSNELPSEPVIAGKVPGANDFTDTGKPSEVGALLGSPAFDMYLKIDGFDGESTDDKHQGWIEVLSYSNGISNEGSALPGGGVGAGTASLSELSVVKTLDKASSKLWLACSEGTHIPIIIIELCLAEQVYMKYELAQAIISSVSVSGSAGEGPLPLEEVTFNYNKIVMTYTKVDP